MHHPLTVTGVLETCLYADDLAAAEKFYTAVLGLEVIQRQEGRHVFFRCGHGVFLVFNAANTSREVTTVDGQEIPLHGALGAGHAAFSVPESELDVWRTHLTAHHIPIESEVRWPNGVRSLYFHDPAGNSVELTSPRLWGLQD